MILLEYMVPSVKYYSLLYAIPQGSTAKLALGFRHFVSGWGLFAILTQCCILSPLQYLCVPVVSSAGDCPSLSLSWVTSLFWAVSSVGDYPSELLTLCGWPPFWAVNLRGDCSLELFVTSVSDCPSHLSTLKVVWLTVLLSCQLWPTALLSC